MAGFSDKELPFFQEGKTLESQLTASRMNGIVRYLRSLTPLKGVGTLVRRLPNGFCIDAIRSSGGSGATIHPYKGFNAGDESNPKVIIQIGSHNDVVPTIDGTPMSANINDNVLTLGGSDQIVYVQLNLNVDTKAIESAEIHSSPDPDPPAGDATTAYQTLFFVSIDGETNAVMVADNVLGSQAFQACGDYYLFGLV